MVRRRGITHLPSVYKCKLFVYTCPVIKSFKHKELAKLWETGKSRIDTRMQRRLLIRLAVLNEAVSVGDINLPGYDFHGLEGFTPKRYTVHVNGPWCLTFEFESGNAYRVDFEQYH